MYSQPRIHPKKSRHIAQFVISTFGESSSRSGTCSPSLPPSLLLLLLLLLPPEPSSPGPLELSPEVDPSGDVAAPSWFSFSLSCERKALQGFVSNSTPLYCNAENLVGIDGCIATILKNRSDTCF
jgi:hypothetical protein